MLLLFFQIQLPKDLYHKFIDHVGEILLAYVDRLKQERYMLSFLQVAFGIFSVKTSFKNAYLECAFNS